MSLWAELNENNKVIRVLVGDDSDPNGDEGYQWLIDNLGGRWIKTQENVLGGIHFDKKGEPDNKPTFRKNTASVDGFYDEDKDAFIALKPHSSWILNKETCVWESPVSYPTDSNLYYWDEESLSWVQYFIEE